MTSWEFVDLILLNCPYLGSDFSVLGLYDQAITLKLRRPRRPDKKSNVGATFEKLATEESADRTRAQYQESSQLPFIRTACSLEV